MGATAADTEREIAALRADATAALAELQRRVLGLRLPAVSPGRVEATRQAADRLRTNPAALGAGGVATLAAVGLAAYGAVNAWTQSRKPQEKVKQRARDVRSEVERRWADAKRLADEARKRGLAVELVGQDGSILRVRNLRVTDRKGDPWKNNRESRDEMLKRLLWLVVLALFMAVAGVVARRGAGAAWRATLREEPPTERR